MEIPEIKSRLTLATVLKHYGLKPDKSQRLHCPFHEDKTPSMQVYYKTHTAYCFSANCKTHGKSLDVIDFVMHQENTDKHKAILKCAEMLDGQPISKESNSNQVKQVAQPSTGREQVLQNMFQYFKNAVHNSKPAQDYIKSRGLDPLKLEIGYNTAQFHHGARRDETLINNCVAVGLLAPWGVNNRKPDEQAYKAFGKFGICFAMRNQENQITGLYFRSTETPPTSLGTGNTDSKHFYLKESTGLYPSYPKVETQKLIITESIIDAASLLQIESIAKDYTILAAYGTNRLTKEHTGAVSQLQNLNEIIFAFDNDEAGNTATIKYEKELKELLPNIIFSTLELPCKDVNETLLAHDSEVFTYLLENRKQVSGDSIQEIFFEKEKVEIESAPTTDNHQLTTKLVTNNPYKLTYTTQTAIYHIKGGVDKVMNKLSVTLEIINENLNESINKRRFKLDLYDNKQIEKAIQEASEILQIDKASIEKDIDSLTEQLDTYRESQQQESKEESTEPAVYLLTPQEKSEALAFANKPNLIQNLTETLTQTGIIGEDENKTFLFIIAASHIQENPLNALIQGSSGSGKTRLLKQIYYSMPDENKKIYSRCSEKMLYNVPKYYFQNKLICFEDVDGLGEEAEYAWRELVSNGELISGVSFKDEKGNIGIKELTVYGPITSLACTTKGAVYADNMSRLFLIAIDESKAQTQKINEYQAQEASGLINKKDQKQAIKNLQNYVRILNPYQVHNPHATKLKLPEGIRDERRLYRLYLYFIDMITVLHQYQRQKQGNKLIATKQDCQIAKDLLFECIMLKMDELDGSLRQFFERLKDYVNKQNNQGHEFTQREIREALSVKKTQLSHYINELIAFEYIQQTSSHINKGNRYRILYFDNYQKVRTDVKQFLQIQIDNINE